MFIILDQAIFILLIFGITLGLIGWIIHLYTILLASRSTGVDKWHVHVSFNEYHEAIPEVILFSAICMFLFMLTLFSLILLKPI